METERPQSLRSLTKIHNYKLKRVNLLISNTCMVFHDLKCSYYWRNEYSFQNDVECRIF